MHPLTREWIDKADGDLHTAQREIRARVDPNYDAVCFHSQQVGEKCIKAVLQEHGIPIPKIHSLTDLLAMITKIDLEFQQIESDAIILEGYAVQFRYPGTSAIKQEARMALLSAERISKFIQTKLNNLRPLSQ